jgi:hypothetical protein
VQFRYSAASWPSITHKDAPTNDGVLLYVSNALPVLKRAHIETQTRFGLDTRIASELREQRTSSVHAGNSHRLRCDDQRRKFAILRPFTHRKYAQLQSGPLNASSVSTPAENRCPV